MYPEKLRKILFYFPPMQLTSIMRQLYLSVYKEGGNVIGEALYQPYGVVLMKGNQIISMREQWSYLILSLAVVLLLIRFEYRKEKK